MDWIVGLQKAARQQGPGLSPEAMERLSSETGGWPNELRTLYAQLDGGEFSEGAVLYPASDLAQRSRELLPGTAYPGTLRIGARGPKQLFVSQKTALSPGHLPELPSWWDAVADDDWVYGARNEQTGETRLYKSLEHLLSVHIPPAETEEFGERTYAKAMSLVQGALDSLKESAEAAVERATEVTESIREDAEKFAENAKSRLRTVGKKLSGARKAKKRPARATLPSRMGAKTAAAKSTKRGVSKKTPARKGAASPKSGGPARTPKKSAGAKAAKSTPRAKTKPSARPAKGGKKSSRSKKSARR